MSRRVAFFLSGGAIAAVGLALAATVSVAAVGETGAPVQMTPSVAIQGVQVAVRRRPGTVPGGIPSEPTTPIPALPSDLLSPSLPVLPSELPRAIAPAPRVYKDDTPRHTLANCMALWDAATHMTKAEWKATCLRSIRESEAAARAVSRKVEKPERRKSKKSRVVRR